MITALLRRLRILPQPEPAPVVTAARRIAVHLPDGSTVVHYGRSRVIYNDGRLTVFYNDDCTRVVADYPSGQWTSMTYGPRKRTTRRKPHQA